MTTTRRVSTARGSDDGAMTLIAQALGPGVVLNIGAGSSTLARADGWTVNVDHVAVPGHVAPFVVAEAGALPFVAGAIDGIVLKDVLEHVNDPLSVLHEAHRTCRLGSTLVMTVPRAIPRAVWSDPTHKRGFTREALIRSLSSTGWSIVTGPIRVGGLPGAARLGLTPYLLMIMRLPGLGHWFGTNWWVTARRAA